MKFALIDSPSGWVVQWQDRTVFNYPPVEPGYEAIPLPDDYEFPDGQWWYINGEFTQTAPPPAPPPPLPPPRYVTSVQLELALLNLGLLDEIETAIGNLEGDARAIEIQWRRTVQMDRDSELMQWVAGVAGLSAEQLQSLFTDAADR